jgi:hypothetical protein
VLTSAPQTAGRWLLRFTLGDIGQLNMALDGVQRRAFLLPVSAR